MNSIISHLQQLTDEKHIEWEECSVLGLRGKIITSFNTPPTPFNFVKLNQIRGNYYIEFDGDSLTRIDCTAGDYLNLKNHIKAAKKAIIIEYFNNV